MKKVLWRPDPQKKTKMTELTDIINHNHGQKVNSYEQLHDWSVNHIPDFWEEVWNYCGIVHSEPCLLYTSPSPRDATLSRMPSSA